MRGNLVWNISVPWASKGCLTKEVVIHESGLSKEVLMYLRTHAYGTSCEIIALLRPYSNPLFTHIKPQVIQILLLTNNTKTDETKLSSLLSANIGNYVKVGEERKVDSGRVLPTYIKA